MNNSNPQNKDDSMLSDKQKRRLERQNKPHPLGYKKAGIRLSRAEVAEIKAARKQLRADLKMAGITKKDDIKILEAARGAYFDKPKTVKAIWMFVGGRVLAILLVSLVALLSLLFIMSEITKMKGHFSVNLTPELFEEGFSISEKLTEEGRTHNPTSYLRAEPDDDTPCISISWIDKDVDNVDGPHNGTGYFAYTFYIENTGEVPASFKYVLNINSESRAVKSAAWVMLFIDGEMSFYAAPTKDGDNQTLPARDDNSRGYRNPPFMSVAKNPEKQFEIIPQDINEHDYYRLIALPFESGDVITSGIIDDVQPGEVHKYTVVLWLEGDDPDCTDELIGGHLGMEFNFEHVE